MVSSPPQAPSIPSSEITLPVPVLVVEDEPLLQRRLKNVLCQLGYTESNLVIVDSLAAARAYLSHQPVALALVDLELPDGNGRSLILELRADDPGLGILVVSAWSSEEAILGALRAGATGYVLKERDDLEVSLSIRSVLRGGVGWAAERSRSAFHPTPINTRFAHVDRASPSKGEGEEEQCFSLPPSSPMVCPAHHAPDGPSL